MSDNKKLSVKVMMVSDINRKHLAAVNIVAPIENNFFLDSSQNVYFP